MSHKPIPSIFILVEGKTEETYLNHLKERGSNFTLHVERFDGNQPLKMVKRCKSRFRERGLGKIAGDKAFCVLDVDYNTLEDLSSAEDYGERNGVSVILSNRCFEVFFLMHYMDDPPLDDPKDAKARLRKFIPNYKESMDVWHLLFPKKDIAIQRSRTSSELGLDIDTKAGSEIWLLFEYLSSLRNLRVPPIYL